ncbi:MAG TPA: hypothetical protein VK427_10495 [Kofleriaceae bacterium]|nr:hypothetical protein [Kofleriaceae bacterium]
MDGLPPASAGIFSHFLFHSTTSRRTGRLAIQRQPPLPRASTASLDAQVAAVVDAPPWPDEDARFAATRKEAELVALFASLTVAEARVLRTRLVHARFDDPIAARLARLAPERRQRLLAFLAEARVRQPDPYLP